MPDIAISFDSTGSMSPAIAEVRRKVTEFIATLFSSVDNLRMSIINHGSYCDGDRLIDILDFTDDKDALIKFVRNTRNAAGCDMQHASYEYVLRKAKTLDWESDSRALVLIGDCEPHPIGYNTSRYDLFKTTGNRNDIDWRLEASYLATICNVKFFPIQALNRHAHTHFYKSLAAMTDSPKLDLMQFSDVAEYLTAIIYSQSGNNRVEEYADKLQTEGLFNRNIANMLNTLLETDRYNVSSSIDNRITTRNMDDSGSLIEVDPSRFQILHVDYNTPIKDFVLSTGARFKIGRGFYQLTKKEEVQERKEVVLVDKNTGDMWSGSAARDMIGLPYGQRGNVSPSYGLKYDVFIQSTSANRKLMGNTLFLYEAK